MNTNNFKSVAINTTAYHQLKELAKNKFDIDVSMAKVANHLIAQAHQDLTVDKTVKSLENFEPS